MSVEDDMEFARRLFSEPTKNGPNTMIVPLSSLAVLDKDLYALIRAEGHADSAVVIFSRGNGGVTVQVVK